MESYSAWRWRRYNHASHRATMGMGLSTIISATGDVLGRGTEGPPYLIKIASAVEARPSLMKNRTSSAMA
ncbi:MAG: hypothetical protein WBA10_18475 [Elainellaceae cyanobacterium]